VADVESQFLRDIFTFWAIKAMVRVMLSHEERRQLPIEAQNALAMAGLLYDDEPEEYAKKAKAPMAAHLTNTAPQLCQ
jgi:hypothetical protein